MQRFWPLGDQRRQGCDWFIQRRPPRRPQTDRHLQSRRLFRLRCQCPVRGHRLPPRCSIFAASYSPPVVKAAYVAPEVEAVLVKEDVVEKVAPASPVYDAKVEAKEAEPIAAPVIKEAETAPPAPEKAYERFAISPAEFTVERFLLLI